MSSDAPEEMYGGSLTQEAGKHGFKYTGSARRPQSWPVGCFCWRMNSCPIASQRLNGVPGERSVPGAVAHVLAPVHVSTRVFRWGDCEPRPGDARMNAGLSLHGPGHHARFGFRRETRGELGFRQCLPQSD